MTNAIEVSKQLYALGMGKRFPVASIEAAQAKWEAFRDGSGAGVSEVGNGVRLVDAHGNFVARISYNGRVWFTKDE